jgi:molybdopterin-containing oxidoreductase family iron-sulfur binding subunit
MSNLKINRRNFLKMLGWGGAGSALAGCDLPTTVTLEEGKEEAVSYFMPEEYVIPGIGVWYASTCTQCEAGCGLHGRVREGRILKLEGNPGSPINHGKTCMMGQAGLQAHYNPDRLTNPMMRKGSSLQTVSWDEAMAELKKRVGPGSGLTGSRFAWLTGTTSGHQSVLISELLGQLNSKNHFAHEVINTSVWQAVCAEMLGDSMPKLRMDKAGVILSFGADFLGTWITPVHFAGEYAKFRKGKRGTLVQVEPKMTITGGNSDLWVPIKPGTEGALALGVANFIIDRGWNKVAVPGNVKTALAKYDLETVAEITGIEVSQIKRIASLLSERAPALVLAGASAESQEKGYESVAAAMLLNIILGSVGNTIEPSKKFPQSALQAKQGNTADLRQFAKGLADKKFDVVFISNSNPVFTAPESLGIEKGLEDAGFTVVFTTMPDETAQKADLILPIYSPYEDWGTHVAAYQPDDPTISFQQPLMEPMYKDSRGLNDLVLEMLKWRSKQYAQFNGSYEYFQTAMANVPNDVAKGGDKEAFWNALLQKGVAKTNSSAKALNAKMVAPKVAGYSENAEYPFHLMPTARLGLWDGRHAHIPWLQEAPDQISKVVWDSWAEIHPKTAAKLGVHDGDIIRVTSVNGTIETQVYIHKGIHPDVVAVPMGQGHEAYGRYAKDRGVNPLKILDPVVESTTGEIALHATRVKLSKAHKHQVLVKLGSSETQQGREFVRTISADQLRRTEKEA